MESGQSLRTLQVVAPLGGSRAVSAHRAPSLGSQGRNTCPDLGTNRHHKNHQGRHKGEEEKQTLVSSEARGESRAGERLRAHSQEAETIGGGGGTGKRAEDPGAQPSPVILTRGFSRSGCRGVDE